MQEDKTKSDEYGNMMAANTFLDFIEFLTDELGENETDRLLNKFNAQIN